MPVKPTKTRPELVNDVWTNVCDILLARKLDRTVATLSRTCRDIHLLAIPKLYHTVRIRNFKDLCLFIWGCDESPYKPPLPLRVLDGREMMHHLEIDCEPRFEDLSPDLPHPIPRFKTCHIRTREDEDEYDPLNECAQFIGVIMHRLPADHVRWEHTRPAGTPSASYIPFRPPKAMRDPGIKSIDFPSTWHNMYDNNVPTPIHYDAHTLGEMGGRWYTNPNNNETDGYLYKGLIEDRRAQPTAKKPMYIVQVARDDSVSFHSDRDEWKEKSIDRQTAGTLTDFAVMAKKGLIDVKVVSVPEKWEPNEWREWISNEGLVPGDVQADLRSILE